jgi:AraC family transcriptional regulator of arabinose operon
MPSLVKTDADPSFRVASVHAGTIVYPPGGTFGPRIQNDFQLVLLHTGAMTIDVDGSPHAVPTGHVAFLTPGHREEFVFSSEESTWHRWISFAFESPPTDEQRRVLERLPFHLPISDQMNQLTDMLIDLMQREGPEYNEVSRQLAQAALWLYIAESRRRDVTVTVHPAVLMTMERIKSHFADDLTVNGLAYEVGVSPEHLIRLFRRYEGITPSQYLWNYRIRRGIELLQSTGLSIGEIAAQTGFKTSYHFARAIKKQTGRTPTEVRRDSLNRGLRLH